MSEAVKVLNDILCSALDEKASDIHIEPREEFIRIRYRIDGLLKEAPHIDKGLQSQIISRIKVMVNLNIAESRLPQDGRFQLDKRHDLRVSTIPTLHGEKVVFRILEKKKTLLKLDELGMENKDLRVFRSLVSQNNGAILVCGPTGAGKTTTLYAALKELNSKENNIVTIEDPIEYQLPSVNQVQVNYKSGLTFLTGLRSILRQDPDIIFVGEIRDPETLRTALQAALTGHLVLSTLHTNDALSAVTRLIEMGVEPYLVSATLKGVVAQRLLRNSAGGRGGVFEVLPITTSIKELIAQKMPKEKLLAQALKEGFTGLQENAQTKIKKGMVLKEEVLRVLGSDQAY